MEDLTNEQLIAVSKAVSAKDFKAASAKTKTGDYPVDFIVRIHGAFSKAAPTFPLKPQKVKPWALVALALAKLNTVTIESLVRDYVDRLDSGEPILGVDDLDKQAQSAIAKIKEGTRDRVSGRVTSSILVEAVPLVEVHRPEKIDSGEEVA
jgi:hypothetical protein